MSFELQLRPDRGLDVGLATFAGTRISWSSPDEAPGTVGLVSTCGLDNVGAPSEGLPPHGTYSYLQARDVQIGGGEARGTIDDPRGLRVERTIRWDDTRLALDDVTTNVAAESLEAPLLYHCNFVWDAVEVDSDEVQPRDDAARAGSPWERGTGPERVYEHRGATAATVVRDGLRLTVRSNLPRLWQWIQPDWGVLGIEPANCSVLGRAHDRGAGTLPVLAPGETRRTTLEITVEAP